VLGTVGYMAPEQVRGLPVDQRADLFALGAILYELLSGLRAFSRDTAPETMAAILNQDPPDLSVAASAIAPALVRIVSRCLEKNPSDRFQTANDLAFALESLSTASSASTAAPAGRRRVPRSWIGWGAAAMLLATLAPVVYQHVRERPAARSPVRFQIPATVAFAGPGNFGLSPDGRHLAFMGLGPDGIAASGSGTWINWKSGRCPVRRRRASRRLLFGPLTDDTSRSTLEADSRSWM